MHINETILDLFDQIETKCQLEDYSKGFKHRNNEICDLYQNLINTIYSKPYHENEVSLAFRACEMISEISSNRTQIKNWNSYEFTKLNQERVYQIAQNIKNLGTLQTIIGLLVKNLNCYQNELNNPNAKVNKYFRTKYEHTFNQYQYYTTTYNRIQYEQALSNEYLQYCTHLEVKPDDSLSTIKKAYMKKARENHPDKGGNEETFKFYSNCYDKIIAIRAPEKMNSFVAENN